MRIGDIIKNYTSENTMSSFCKRSGLSRAYAYMLIKGINNQGKQIVPTLATIQQVANGVGKTFEEVLASLDLDYIIKIKSKSAETPESKDIIDMEKSAIKRFSETKEQQDSYFLDLARKDNDFLQYMRKAFNLKDEYKEEIYKFIDYTCDREKKESGQLSTKSEGA